MNSHPRGADGWRQWLEVIVAGVATMNCPNGPNEVWPGQSSLLIIKVRSIVRLKFKTAFAIWKFISFVTRPGAKVRPSRVHAPICASHPSSQQIHNFLAFDSYFSLSTDYSSFFLGHVLFLFVYKLRPVNIARLQTLRQWFKMSSKTG